MLKSVLYSLNRMKTQPKERNKSERKRIIAENISSKADMNWKLDICLQAQFYVSWVIGDGKIGEAVG